MLKGDVYCSSMQDGLWLAQDAAFAEIESWTSVSTLGSFLLIQHMTPIYNGSRAVIPTAY